MFFVVDIDGVLAANGNEIPHYLKQLVKLCALCYLIIRIHTVLFARQAVGKQGEILPPSPLVA